MIDILLLVILLFVLVLAGIITVRTFGFKNRTKNPQSPAALPLDMRGAEKLSETVKIQTVSNGNNQEAFLQLHLLLEKLFPLFHAHCEKTVVNGYSLVYRWPAGTDRQEGKPILITAHMDVVPVEPGTEADWARQPFGGEVADGKVWGRGTLDTKVHIVAALEAAERLLAEGFAPARDIYFAFGHDEEVGGEQGARRIAQYFQEKGLAFDFVLDEGGCIVEGALEGVHKPIALIGVGEKGYANIKLTAAQDGGHSSMPAKHSSLGVLAMALCRLEAHAMRPRLIKPVREFLMRVGPEMGLANRIILANLWLFQPLFIHMFAQTRSGSAMLRTTTAVTMAEGSPAPNVMPQHASAVVNFRIIPGETGKDLLFHIKRTLKGLPVEAEPLALAEPSSISSSDSEGYRNIERLIGEVFGDVIMAPYLVMASTDARKYEPVCEHIYRFSPYLIQNDELSKMHGTNENITIENIGRGIAFFRNLFQIYGKK